MFLRYTTRKKNGKAHRYYSIVENKRCAGGRIVLSGILESQAAEVAAAYARDFDAGVVAVEEGWALVGGKRR